MPIAPMCALEPLSLGQPEWSVCPVAIVVCPLNLDNCDPSCGLARGGKEFSRDTDLQHWSLTTRVDSPKPCNLEQSRTRGPPDRAPGRGHWLLARRSLSDPTEIFYYICSGLRRTTLTEVAAVA